MDFSNVATAMERLSLRAVALNASREGPKMRKWMTAATILALIGASPVLIYPVSARGGMHGHTGSPALSAPANPTVPPSLTPDARLTGSAPVPGPHPRMIADGGNIKPDPEDAKVYRIVRSICRGC
jgi:hypothetical protein